MNPRLDTLATALYVRIDDLLAENPGWAPQRPAVGIKPELADAGLVALAVVSALLGFDSESRFVCYAKAHLRPWFPYLPNRDGCNKRLRRSGEMIARVVERLARECPCWSDDVWLADSTPIGCGRSRQTRRRSELAGWAQYGYSASRSRWFWGLRLHLLTTPAGLPAAFAPAGAKADEREICADMIASAGLARPGQTLIAGKGYRSAQFEARLAQAGITVIRPATKKEPSRPGARFPRPLRQIIESVNNTPKTQLSLERHRGRTRAGVAVRILTRILAPTAAIWHNQTTHQPGPARSLTTYDH